MKLTEWAAIAEIISGLAVVVTLVFLVIGIRENTEITRAAMFERNLDSLNQWRALLISEGLVEDWTNYMETASVSGRRSDLDVVNLMLFAIYEKTYFAYRYGAIGDDEWARFRNQICLRDEQQRIIFGVSTREEDLRSGTMSPAFLDYIYAECQSTREEE